MFVVFGFESLLREDTTKRAALFCLKAYLESTFHQVDQLIESFKS